MEKTTKVSTIGLGVSLVLVNGLISK